ncbi:MAG: PH domain-containing protein [Chitinophagaceae bacterium]|nr:PH domain-containing protein [Chitinophagaceae bacterium]
MTLYKTSLDRTAKAITAITLLLLAFISYRNWFVSSVPVWLKIVITLSFLAIVIIAWIYAPQNYLIENETLVINRAVGRVYIPLNGIVGIREVNKKELGTLIRLWGSGGLFGYYGKFRSTRMGKLTLYTTRRSNLVLLTTDSGEKILLSPDDISVIDSIRGYLPV